MTDDAAKKHPLVGAGLLSKNEDGSIKYQASVLEIIPSGSSTTGDLALIQLYEWIMGEPSTRLLVPLSELASSQWVVFSDVEEMSKYYGRVLAPKRDWGDRGAN